MKIKPNFLPILFSVLCVSAAAYAQQEELILSTYYPAPFGEYEEMASENLFTDRQIIGNMDVNGDGNFSTLDDIALVGNGNLLVEGRVGIGTTSPLSALHLHSPAWNTDVYIGNPPQAVHGHTQADAAGIFISSDTNYASPGGFGGHLFLINKETRKTWHLGVSNNDGLRVTETGVTTSMHFSPGGNVGIGTTSPGTKLDVKGDIKLSDNSDDTLDFGWGSKIWRRSSDGHLVLEGQGGVVEIQNSNVGIGTTNPQAKLHVAGDVYAEGSVYGSFTDRGDPGGWDFSESSLVLDGNWHDLNLGSIVPSGAKAILVRMQAWYNTPGNYFEVRKNGNTNVHSASQVMIQTSAAWSVGEFVFICDSNRIVEYRSTASGMQVRILVRGWW